MKIESLNKVDYGAEEIEGKWVPYIALGVVADGRQLKFQSNLKFEKMEDAREFIIITHKILSSPEAQKYNFDLEGNL